MSSLLKISGVAVPVHLQHRIVVDTRGQVRPMGGQEVLLGNGLQVEDVERVLDRGDGRAGILGAAGLIDVDAARAQNRIQESRGQARVCQQRTCGQQLQEPPPRRGGIG
jgi:hypothetical protein